MSWYALSFVFLMVVLTFILIIKWNWPRDRDGKLLSIEEAVKFFNKFPDPPPSAIKMLALRVIILFATIAMFAVAITRQKDYNPDTDIDSDYH